MSVLKGQFSSKITTNLIKGLTIREREKISKIESRTGVKVIRREKNAKHEHIQKHVAKHEGRRERKDWG
jgi:hypothetical protein